jgi:hypothetical protein
MLTRFTGKGNIGHHSRHPVADPVVPVHTEEPANDDNVGAGPTYEVAAEPAGDQDDVADDGDNNDDDDMDDDGVDEDSEDDVEDTALGDDVMQVDLGAEDGEEQWAFEDEE